MSARPSHRRRSSDRPVGRPKIAGVKLAAAVAAALAIAVIIAAIIAAVVFGDDEPSGPRALTDTEAALLSQVLVRDLEAEGADVRAVVEYGPDTQLVLDAAIDWVEHTGEGTLTTTIEPSADPGPAGEQEEVTEVTDVRWNETTVALRAAGGEWTRRPADPSGVPLDQVIALLVATAGPERDNPLLVAQSGAQWIGEEEVDGVTVDVIDGGGRLTYWIGRDDGVLRRLEARIAGFDAPTIITFERHGPRDIPPIET
jgi:hypothetical protein